LSYGEKHTDAQQSIMNLFCFSGSWEDFGKLGASGFAETTYGSSYTDRKDDMQKFAMKRQEERYGT